MSEFRWVVEWVKPSTESDFDLMHRCRDYFQNEHDAINFAESKKLKEKPVYWQPYVWKEEKVQIKYFEWRAVK